MILHINDQEQFNEAIKEGKVFVDFFATWCGPCQMLAPVLEEMDRNGEFGDIKVIKVDVDEAPEIAGAFNIQSIPTLLLFQDGKIIDSRLGFMPKPMLLKFLGK